VNDFRELMDEPESYNGCMAAKTDFSKRELINILGGYDVGEYKSHRAFEQGADQTNILLETTQGKFAYRYYEKRSKSLTKSLMCYSPIKETSRGKTNKTIPTYIPI
jgi:hypothetical protein